MKEELMTEIMQHMLSYLDNAQLKQLRQVMERVLFQYEVAGRGIKPEKDDSNELISMFIVAKRIEGCSEKALYWATVSLTTVGYGDIYPVSTAGKIITMISSVFGIAIVALPAGIITAGYMDEIEQTRNNSQQPREEADPDHR